MNDSSVSEVMAMWHDILKVLCDIVGMINDVFFNFIFLTHFYKQCRRQKISPIEHRFSSFH